MVLVELEPTVGHEQRGLRPCVVVSSPSVASCQKFPMLCVVPVSSTPGEGALYPKLRIGRSGLRNESFALIDQLRSLDKLRVRRRYGCVSPVELGSLEEGIRLYLSL